MGRRPRLCPGAGMGCGALHKHLVGLIADVKQTALGAELVDLAQQLGRHHHAAGIVGRHGHDRPGAGGDRRRQLLGIGESSSGHSHRLAPGQLHRHHVVEIKGQRQDHLAARFTDRLHDHLEGHVAATGDEQGGAS